MNLEQLIRDSSDLTQNQEGVWCKLSKISPEQQQTKDSFSYKWNKTDTYGSQEGYEETRKWLLEKYFDKDTSMMEKYFFKDCILLDAGCGAGYSATALLGQRLNDITYIGTDISDSVFVAKETFHKLGYNGHFLQCDLNNLPFKNGVFDCIFSEGVLHHTNSTEEAIKALVPLLKPSGTFMFYIYVKKAPIREFCDDYIRAYFANATDKQTWSNLKALQSWGRHSVICP